MFCVTFSFDMIVLLPYLQGLISLQWLIGAHVASERFLTEFLHTRKHFKGQVSSPSPHVFTSACFWTSLSEICFLHL